ncbi:MAG: DUF4351 domain-containing protein [Nevskiaceae bacterium]|nr:DUF4351 domain-containing protein [Nevskiaceae bacterium]
MVSQEHEILLVPFRNRLTLAPEMLREGFGVALPEFTTISAASADLTQIEPTEYRADLVLHLHGAVADDAVAAIIVEAQRSIDDDKQYSWPAYVANLRAQLRRPVYLLVVTADETVARWAAKPIDLGGGNSYSPFVLSPAAVPIITDEQRACAAPELALLSVIAHARSRDPKLVLKIAKAAIAAILKLQDDRARLYFDVVFSLTPEAYREEFRRMALTYEYQSDFARKYVAQGREEGRAEGREKGRAEGRAALLTEQLKLRFGPLPESAQKRLSSASIDQLDEMGRRLLSANSLNEVLNLN